jgi:hypothetical protein
VLHNENRIDLGSENHPHVHQGTRAALVPEAVDRSCLQIIEINEEGWRLDLQIPFEPSVCV